MKIHKMSGKAKSSKILSLLVDPISRYSLLIILLFFDCVQATRMVRLCIASVDPIKLSSQCVMCNRREFPLTAIGCTGIDRMNDLIANPLSVRQALCLINNCRKQVPHVKPEPYHGSVTQAATRGNYPSVSGSRNYEMMSPASMYGVGSGYPSTATSSMSRYRGALPFVNPSGGLQSATTSRLTPDTFGMGGSSAGTNAAPTGLPYALVPEPYSPSLFGSRRIKATLVPLFDGQPNAGY